MIGYKNLSFSYKEKLIFQDATFQLHPGMTFIFGKNGSGKSTLLKWIAGWLDKSAEPKPSVSYLPANYSLNQNLTVKDIADMYSVPWKNLNASFLFTSFSLHSLTPATRAYELSSGDLQKLLLSVLLLQKTTFLLLDEPLNHLDFISQKKLLLALSTSAISYVVVTSHDFQAPLQIENSRILLIDNKKIHDLGPSREALISDAIQNSFSFQSQIIDNPIDRTSILAIAEKQ